GCAAMDELVAKDVEAVKNKAENACGIPGLKCLGEGSDGGIETRLPVFIPIDPIVVLPKRIEHEPVVHEEPDGAGEPLPQGLVDLLLLVQRDKLAEEIQKGRAFTRCDRLELALVGIGRIEGNPEKQEACIVVPVTG